MHLQFDEVVRNQTDGYIDMMPDLPKYRVYLIESPSPKDFYLGFNNAHVLEQSLSRIAIPVTHRVVVNEEFFVEAMSEMIDTFTKNKEIPILHIFAHGNADEIGFTSDQALSLDHMGEFLKKANDLFDSKLVVCLSACEGHRIVKTGLKNSESPFDSLIACMGKPEWEECLVGFTAFYFLLSKGKTLQEAFNGLVAASGRTDFKLTAGQRLVELGEWIRKADPKKLQAALEEMIKKNQPNTST